MSTTNVSPKGSHHQKDNPKANAPETHSATAKEKAAATKILAAHREVCKAGQSHLNAAMAAGDLLVKVKKELGKRGDYLDWCQQHVPEIGKRTCQIYAKLADNRKKVERYIDDSGKAQHAALISIRGALAFISPPKKKQKQKNKTADKKPYLAAAETAANELAEIKGYLKDMTPEDRTEVRHKLDEVRKLLADLESALGGRTAPTATADLSDVGFVMPHVQA
jgi:hypothetical protein